LRGRGYIGTASFRVEAPAEDAPITEFFATGYRPRVGTSAINRGNAVIDWDPFTTEIDDAPSYDLAGQVRVKDGQIDLGAFEIQ
jgi:hypothetical protein